MGQNFEIAQNAHYIQILHPQMSLHGNKCTFMWTPLNLLKNDCNYALTFSEKIRKTVLNGFRLSNEKVNFGPIRARF